MLSHRVSSLLASLVFAFLLGACGPNPEPGQSESSTVEPYRAGDALGTHETVSLASVLDEPARFTGATVRIEGTIDQVCQKKGCWMILRDGDQSVRVTFKDYGFFVPTDTEPGRRVRIDAAVAVEVMAAEMARHLEEETEGGDPESVTGPQKVVSVVASGVEIEMPEQGSD